MLIISVRITRKGKGYQKPSDEDRDALTQCSTAPLAAQAAPCKLPGAASTADRVNAPTEVVQCTAWPAALH